MKRNGSRGSALAAQFRNQAKAVQQTATVKLPIPSIAPDFVFEFVARRINLYSLLFAGKLPESLSAALLGAKDPETAERVAENATETAQAMTLPEQLEMLEFQWRIAQEVCVEPRLVMSDSKSEEEIDLRQVDFAGQLIIALYNYAMNLSREVPVATADGQATTVGAVETFPSVGELPNAGADGAAVRQAA